MIDFCDQWFLDTVKNYLYEDAVALVREHREQGHVLALLTAATPYVSIPAARYLGIDSVLCTRLEVDDQGLFTGRLLKPLCHGDGKLHWARHFCDEHGLELAESYFYTDSIRDLPVLEKVRHAVPVNPDRFLRRQAGKSGWAVKRFKKTLGT